EGAEGGDVGDDAFELHAGLQIFEGVDVVAKLRRLEALTRVAPRLLELADDVAQGGLADAVADVLRDLDAVGEAGVADELLELYAKVRGHALHQRVALRVHGRGVERVVAAVHAQEARRLLEGARPHAADLQQAEAPLEGAALVA